MIIFFNRGYNEDLIDPNYTLYLQVYSLYALINIFSASVMIFAIVYFRCKVNSLQKKVVSSRERLMVVHASFFTICIILNICSLVFNELYVKSRQNYIMESYQEFSPDS